MNIAVFPADVDCLFLNKILEKKGHRVLFFVEANSQIEAWIKQLPDKNNLVDYHFLERSYNNDLEELLYKTDLDRLFNKHSITIAYSSLEKNNQAVEYWAKAHGCRFLVTPYVDGGYLENKIVFDNFLKINKINKPQSQIYHLNSNVHIAPPLVLQVPESSGSEGTYYIKDESDLSAVSKIIPSASDGKYLLRKYINGKTYGISVFICNTNIILSSIREQCGHEGFYAGIQWIGASALKKNLLVRIEELFIRIGMILYRRKYKGFANFDFIVDDNEKIYVLECNPRYSAAITHFAVFPELISGIDFTSIMLESSGNELKTPGIVRIPGIDFTGALLYIDIHPNRGSYVRVNKNYPSGVYEIKEGQPLFISPDYVFFDNKKNKFLFVSEAGVGEKFHNNHTAATIFSNFPLYENGNINEYGKILLRNFRYL